MKIQRTILFSLSALMIFSMLLVVYARNNDDKRRLGVEINTKSVFYFPAAIGSETITGLVRIGNSENTSANNITGLKIVPKVENGKVRVEVFAVYGDIHAIKSCEELENFKSKPLGSQVLSKGESLDLSKLANLKPSENSESLQVKIVEMKKDFNDHPVTKISSAAQVPSGCGGCGDIICCPRPGQCFDCGNCGLVCRRGGGGGEEEILAWKVINEVPTSDTEVIKK